MNTVQKWASAIVAGLVIGAAAQADVVSDAIAERIAPVGEVCVAGEQCAAATTAAAASGPRSAEDIYNGSCMACHSTGAGGAPKAGEAGDWSARMEQGIEAVYANAIGGVGGMPPKGTCMSCSDDEIKAVVDYLVDQLK